MNETALRDPQLPGWAALWFGVAGGQAAWAAAVLIAYPTVAVVCDLGADRVWIHLVRWVAGAIAAAAVVVAHRNARRGQAAGDDVPPGEAARARFMGVGGLLLSAVAVFLLFVEDLATWVIDPCL